MMTMHAQVGLSTRILWTMLLAGLVLGGCRTYGGYGAEEEILQQIEETNQLFAEDLQRARADMNLLAEAASGDSALRAFARQYQNLLLAHEALLAENRELESQLEEGSPSYRDLHRVYGAILSEQRLVHKQYRILLASMQRQDDTTAASPDLMFTQGHYRAVPIFYRRLQNAGATPTMRQALQGMEAPTEVPSALPEGPPGDTATAVGE